MTKKEIAISFLKAAGAGNVRQAFDHFVSKSFIHHNQYFKGDRETLLLAMEENALKNPDKKIEIKKALEDGNEVMTFSHVIPQPGDLGAAVVHIFHFKNEKITELWDLGAPLPKDSPNSNGMF